MAITNRKVKAQDGNKEKQILCRRGWQKSKEIFKHNGTENKNN